MSRFASRLVGVAVLLHFANGVRAQAGPPFLTNDPGTPGNANWEINVATMEDISRGASSYQLPQVDLNFGVGDRIQLTFEIPYVLQQTSGDAVHRGWGNANPGVKWRFLDQGEEGWQASVFPQMETGVASHARQVGLGVAGPRYLLPFEVTKKVGNFNLDFEAGYYVAGHGPKERIFGIVAGRSVSEGLELDAELYDDRAYDGGPHSTSLDVGGRYTLRRGVIALFMAGRSVTGFSNGQPQFIGYLGIQILLSDYGRSMASE